MRERPAIDSHRLWQHGPLLLFENHGDFTLSHAERVTGVYEEVVASEGFLLLLLDLADPCGPRSEEILLLEKEEKAA